MLSGHLFAALQFGYDVGGVYLKGAGGNVQALPADYPGDEHLASWSAAYFEMAMTQVAAGFAAGELITGQGLGDGHADLDNSDRNLFAWMQDKAQLAGQLTGVRFARFEDAVGAATTLLRTSPWYEALQESAFPAVLLTQREMTVGACLDALGPFGVTTAHIGRGRVPNPDQAACP
ncbi:hypothetical protein [Deinococcus soli (ex Cha et al. 2016)]|uniref:hypothetical protein n=1 Tax=Deinococcus soli (ex Cha et al. 2016) TaxID=1309411 RepID=UPI0028569D58|nr:hypothetical protein [Deinococcus soli (ex Cha et al. 2016)]MDR6331414.1 hypothetical protein [Deinococcus soli (ex Cha et al. 2016)]